MDVVVGALPSSKMGVAGIDVISKLNHPIQVEPPVAPSTTLPSTSAPTSPSTTTGGRPTWRTTPNDPGSTSWIRPTFSSQLSPSPPPPITASQGAQTTQPSSATPVVETSEKDSATAPVSVNGTTAVPNGPHPEVEPAAPGPSTTPQDIQRPDSGFQNDQSRAVETVNPRAPTASKSSPPDHGLTTINGNVGVYVPPPLRLPNQIQPAIQVFNALLTTQEKNQASDPRVLEDLLKKHLPMVILRMSQDYHASERLALAGQPCADLSQKARDYEAINTFCRENYPSSWTYYLSLLSEASQQLPHLRAGQPSSLPLSNPQAPQAPQAPQTLADRHPQQPHTGQHTPQSVANQVPFRPQGNQHLQQPVAGYYTQVPQQSQQGRSYGPSLPNQSGSIPSERTQSHKPANVPPRHPTYVFQNQPNAYPPSAPGPSAPNPPQRTPSGSFAPVAQNNIDTILSKGLDKAGHHLQLAWDALVAMKQPLVETSQAKINTLENEVSQLRTVNERLQEQFRKQTHKISIYIMNERSLHKELEMAKQELGQKPLPPSAEMEAKVKELERRLEASRSARADLTQENQTHKAAILAFKELVKDKDTAIADLQQSIEKKSTALEKAIQDKEADIEVLEAKLAESLESSSFREQYESLKGEADSLRSELQTVKEELEVGKVTESERGKELEVQNAELKAKVATLENDKIALEHSIADANTRTATFAARFESQRTAETEGAEIQTLLEKQLADAKIKIGELESQCDVHQNAERQRAETQALLEEKTQEVRALEDQLTGVDVMRLERSRKEQELMEQVRFLKTETSRLRKHYDVNPKHPAGTGSRPSSDTPRKRPSASASASVTRIYRASTKIDLTASRSPSPEIALSRQVSLNSNTVDTPPEPAASFPKAHIDLTGTRSASPTPAPAPRPQANSLTLEVSPEPANTAPEPLFMDPDPASPRPMKRKRASTFSTDTEVHAQWIREHIGLCATRNTSQEVVCKLCYVEAKKKLGADKVGEIRGWRKLEGVESLDQVHEIVEHVLTHTSTVERLRKKRKREGKD